MNLLSQITSKRALWLAEPFFIHGFSPSCSAGKGISCRQCPSVNPVVSTHWCVFVTWCITLGHVSYKKETLLSSYINLVQIKLNFSMLSPSKPRWCNLSHGSMIMQYACCFSSRLDKQKHSINNICIIHCQNEMRSNYYTH